MLRLIAALLAASMLAACAAGPAGVAHGAADHRTPDYPEARPYDESADAQADVDSAIARAAADNTLVLIVMGANWCHDSRAFAGWLATPRFAELLDREYEVVFVDTGMPRQDEGRNLDIAARYGIEIVGTPSIIIATPQGKVLNPDTAARWYDAASRGEEAIFRELESYVILPDG